MSLISARVSAFTFASGLKLLAPVPNDQVDGGETLVGDYDIAYTCDVTDGMVGAPIYIYDQETKSRYIIGVNIGDFGEKNWGLRMYQALFEWIQTVNK